jgi:N-methylhydantoinase B/oxoprolinase/acetone carboxylase alpha subunit
MMGGGAGWGEPSARKGELTQQDLETGMISEKRVSKAG